MAQATLWRGRQPSHPASCRRRRRRPAAPAIGSQARLWPMHLRAPWPNGMKAPGLACGGTREGAGEASHRRTTGAQSRRRRRRPGARAPPSSHPPPPPRACRAASAPAGRPAGGASAAHCGAWSRPPPGGQAGAGGGSMVGNHQGSLLPAVQRSSVRCGAEASTPKQPPERLRLRGGSSCRCCASHTQARLLHGACGHRQATQLSRGLHHAADAGRGRVEAQALQEAGLHIRKGGQVGGAGRRPSAVAAAPGVHLRQQRGLLVCGTAAGRSRGAQAVLERRRGCDWRSASGGRHPAAGAEAPGLQASRNTVYPSALAVVSYPGSEERRGSEMAPRHRTWCTCASCRAGCMPPLCAWAGKAGQGLFSADTAPARMKPVAWWPAAHPSRWQE